MSDALAAFRARWQEAVDRTSVSTYESYARFAERAGGVGPLIVAMASAMERGATPIEVAGMQFEVARLYRRLALEEVEFDASSPADHALYRAHRRRALRSAAEYYDSAIVLAGRAGDGQLAETARAERRALEGPAGDLGVPLPR